MRTLRILNVQRKRHPHTFWSDVLKLVTFVAFVAGVVYLSTL